MAAAAYRLLVQLLHIWQKQSLDCKTDQKLRTSGLQDLVMGHKILIVLSFILGQFLWSEFSLAHFFIHLILLFQYCSNNPVKAILSFLAPMLKGSHLRCIIAIFILAFCLRFCRQCCCNHLRIFIFAWEKQKYCRDFKRVHCESMLGKTQEADESGLFYLLPPQ